MWPDVCFYSLFIVVIFVRKFLVISLRNGNINLLYDLFVSTFDATKSTFLCLCSSVFVFTDSRFVFGLSTKMVGTKASLIRTFIFILSRN